MAREPLPPIREINFDDLLDPIEAALKKVTPGPWRVEEHRRQNVETVRGLAICYLGQNSIAAEGYFQQITTDEAEANARFVAHAPNWLALLVSRVRQAEQERDTLRAALQGCVREMIDSARHIGYDEYHEALKTALQALGEAPRP